MSINIAKIYSILGSESSIVPLAVKDSFSSLGMTSGSFITGQEEGYDRFIDEVGTEIVWLGGVPVYRWLFDKTAFKIYGFDSKYDARNLKNKDIFERTKKYAPDEEIKTAIEKIEKKQKMFKNLTASKFILSTSLAIMSYIMLTKYKQKYTEKQIKKKLINEYQSKQKEQKDNSLQEKKTQKNTDFPSFKSLGSMTESLAYNSVKNMWIVDGAITSERLLDSRNPQEFIGYAIKEAFSLCFLYYAGGKIQKLLENNAMKRHNRNIALDARVLENNYIKQIFKDGTIKTSLDNFLKELGTGFSYIENEYKIKVGNTYNYIDILLFNYIYNCFVVIELKVTELKKEHIGQIQIYMNYVDKNIKTINQDKTIGVIICKKDDDYYIEYSSDSRIIKNIF